MADLKTKAVTFGQKFREGKGIYAVLNPGGALYSFFQKKKAENAMTEQLRDQYQERLTGLLEEQYASRGETSNAPYIIAGISVISMIALLIIYKKKKA